MDVGAGSGFFSRYLLNNSGAKDAWCVDISYEDNSDSLENGKRIHFRQSIDSTDADLVLLMDVLEHVDDDVGLLRSYVSKAPKGTRFLISVPAFQFLWSNHDVFLDHKRRYRLHQIEEVARSAGLTVTKGVYYFGAVFPIAAAIRLWGRKATPNLAPRQSHLSQHGLITNSSLSGICNFELGMKI